MDIKRLTTTALVVGSAALVSAGAFVGASLSDDDDSLATPIGVAAQATTAPEQTQPTTTPNRQRGQQDRGVRGQRDSRNAPAPSPSTGQQTTTQPSAGIAIVGGDADVFGDQVRLETETTQTASRVEFTYGGQRYTGELTETDAEDFTKEWGVTVPSLAADRTPGETLEFRVQACDSQCAEADITELVEFDD